jgi:hypothetical protein
MGRHVPFGKRMDVRNYKRETALQSQMLGRKKKMFIVDIRNSIERDGFVVVPLDGLEGWTKESIEYAALLISESEHTETIFQYVGNPELQDGPPRQQIHFDVISKDQQKTLKEWGACNKIVNALMKRAFPSLKSKPGTAIYNGAIRQDLHMDQAWTEPFRKFRKKAPANGIPCSVLVATDTGTFLWVCKGSHKELEKLAEGGSCKKIPAELVHIPKGNACIFRSDLVHAGAKYWKNNLRLHYFYDHPQNLREDNTTGDLQEVHEKAGDYFHFSNQVSPRPR